MAALKAFAWFTLKVAGAYILIQIVDAKTGLFTKARDLAGGITGA